MSDPHASSSAHAAAPADDEPQTPMWLPALGAALFVSVALWWAVTPSAPSPDAAAAAASASAAASAVAVPTPPPAPTPQPIAPPHPMPSSSAVQLAPGVQEMLRNRKPRP
jgi:hypothetical protein